jgi:hypothetical protein
VQDIEDMKRLVGFQDKACPYFYSRDVSSSADLVLLPYNYLLDTSIRATLKLQWQNAVIIFDEAHNLERVASDAASFSLTSADIARVIEELQNVLRRLTTSGGYLYDADDAADAEKDRGGKDEKPAVVDLTNGSGLSPTLAGVTRVLQAVFVLERKLDAVPLSLAREQPLGRTPSCVLPGAWMCELMEDVGLHHNMVRACLPPRAPALLTAASAAPDATLHLPLLPRLTMPPPRLCRPFRTSTSSGVARRSSSRRPRTPPATWVSPSRNPNSRRSLTR